MEKLVQSKRTMLSQPPFSSLVTGDRINYRCFDELERLLAENEEFRKVILEGMQTGKICGFSEELWQKIHDQNIRVINNFEDVFVDGNNIGYCTVAAKQVSYSIPGALLAGGVLPILSGTRNCADGSHTWIVDKNMVLDTTLMLLIDSEYTAKLGYIQERIDDPTTDPNYLAAQEFTLDPSIRPKKI